MENIERKITHEKFSSKVFIKTDLTLSDISMYKDYLKNLETLKDTSWSVELNQKIDVEIELINNFIN